MRLFREGYYSWLKALLKRKARRIYERWFDGQETNKNTSIIQCNMEVS